MIRRAAVAILLALMPAVVLGANPAGAQGRRQLSPMQKRLLSGSASLALDQESATIPTPPLIVQGSAGPLAQTVQTLSGLDPKNPQNYVPAATRDCGFKTGSNVKVNQNCLNIADADLFGRAQAQNETSIAQDPNAPNHIVAAFNDYRRGDGNCGVAWSVNGGETWNDSTVPNGFMRGAAFGGFPREYFQAGSDPSVAWDTQGNAYLACLMFNRGTPTSGSPDFSSAVSVSRSTANFGASWNFPPRPVAQQSDRTGLGAALLDKPYMTIDNTKGSPFQDRIYVTWTFFAPDGTAYIFGAHSADYGQTFSAPVLVSRDSGLCADTLGVPTPQGRCNVNQFSQPFTAPDGALYVLWSNFNSPPSNASDNHAQILLAKSTDGGVTFGAPVKVADYFDLPDCATYQAGKNPGNACVPEKGATANSVFRASNYASGAVNPKSNAIVVAFGSYINAHSNESNGCVPTGFAADVQALYTGVKTPGACNNDILVSVSTDAGATFTGTTTDPRQLTSATSAPAQATTDQWFQWIAFTKSGRLAISYYDRQYGDAETTGFSDISLSGSEDAAQFAVKRVTSSPIPPPTQFLGTFWGDYTGLSALDNKAHPLWSDTRNPLLALCPGSGVPGVPPAVCLAAADNAPVANDQDVYTDGVPVPH